jgi:hypothetical protein
MDMSVSVEIHHTGSDPGQRAEIAAHIEHALADRAGDWHVSIVGSQANDNWEITIAGPNGFERSYTLEGMAGEHERMLSHVLWPKWYRRFECMCRVSSWKSENRKSPDDSGLLYSLAGY